MNQSPALCPACSTPMEAGYLSSGTGPIQWTVQQPGVMAKWLQSGEALVEPSVYSHLEGWRCAACRQLLLTYQPSAGVYQP